MRTRDRPDRRQQQDRGPGRPHHGEREPEGLDDPDRVRERADERHPDRHQDERPEGVVRRHTRLRALRHLLLEHREPEREVHGDPEAADERGGGDHRGRSAQRERERLERDQRRGEDAGDERPAGTHPDREDPAEHGAHAAGGQDHRPRPGAAEPLVRDRGPEDDPPGEREVPDPEEEHRGPEPRPPRELVPALAQLVHEAVRGRRSVRRDADAAQEIGADEKAHRVERKGDAGARGDDDQAAERGPEHADHVAREPLQGVRLLEPRRAHGLRHEPHLRGQHEAEPEAVDGLKRHDRADAADAGDDAGRRRRLGRPLHERRADEHEVPRDPVGQDHSTDDDERLDALPHGEDDAERRRRGHVEDRERQRDAGETVADRRDRRPGEEQAEVALLERTEASAERHRHGRRLVARALLPTRGRDGSPR
jgi:hypothetical protein